MLNGKRIAELDGIRGLAIGLVLVWHYAGTTLPPPLNAHRIWPFVDLGWTGVDLFFVLSGFLIGGILLDNRDATNYFRTFYIRRVCRIFPLYFAWLFIFIVLSYVTPAGVAPWGWLVHDRRLPLWSYFSFTQNVSMARASTTGPAWLGITWSLAIEEQFYLTLPLLIYLVPKNRIVHVVLALAAMAPILRILLFRYYGNGPFADYVLMPCRIDALMIGVLLAYGVREPRISALLRAHRPALYGVLAACLVAAANLAVRGDLPQSWAASSYGFSVLAMLYGSFLALAVTERAGPASWIARRPMLQRLGIIAYGVYLLHQAMLGLAHGLVGNAAPVVTGWREGIITVSALCLTILVARLSWHLFERPIMAFGHRYRYDHAHARRGSTMALPAKKGRPAGDTMWH